MKNLKIKHQILQLLKLNLFLWFISIYIKGLQPFQLKSHKA